MREYKFRQIRDMEKQKNALSAAIEKIEKGLTMAFPEPKVEDGR